MKVAVQGYNAGKAWLCICVGVSVEPPFSKSWIRHCTYTHSYSIICIAIPICNYWHIASYVDT